MECERKQTAETRLTGGFQQSLNIFTRHDLLLAPRLLELLEVRAARTRYAVHRVENYLAALYRQLENHLQERVNEVNGSALILLRHLRIQFINVARLDLLQQQLSELRPHVVIESLRV